MTSKELKQLYDYERPFSQPFEDGSVKLNLQSVYFYPEWLSEMNESYAGKGYLTEIEAHEWLVEPLKEAAKEAPIRAYQPHQRFNKARPEESLRGQVEALKIEAAPQYGGLPLAYKSEAPFLVISNAEIADDKGKWYALDRGRLAFRLDCFRELTLIPPEPEPSQLVRAKKAAADMIRRVL